MSLSNANSFAVIALLLVGAEVVASDPPELKGSYVVVRRASERSKPRGVVHGCMMAGRVVAQSARIMDAKVLVIEAVQKGDGGVVPSDVAVANVAVGASGSFRIISESSPPLIVTASLAGHDTVVVVLETCDVEVDFYLGPRRE